MKTFCELVQNKIARYVINFATDVAPHCDLGQDWQPYTVDPYATECVDHHRPSGVVVTSQLTCAES